MFCALFLRPTLAKNSITHICMHVQDIYASSNVIHIIIFWRALTSVLLLVLIMGGSTCMFNPDQTQVKHMHMVVPAYYTYMTMHMFIF